MTTNNEILYDVALFQDIEPRDLSSMLTCLAAETINYEKGDIILLAGSKPEHVGIVLSGLLQIVKEDYEGKRTIIAVLEPGDYFAEALCCAGVDESPVTVIADTASEVMRINFSRILQTCPNSCSFHQKLIGNMLGIIAKKNLFLQSRMEVVCIKSLREKVLKYLESFGARQGKTVTIPLSREAMAEYLSVDRSALSHELMKMRREGLLDYDKNVFVLK